MERSISGVFGDGRAVHVIENGLRAEPRWLEPDEGSTVPFAAFDRLSAVDVLAPAKDGSPSQPSLLGAALGAALDGWLGAIVGGSLLRNPGRRAQNAVLKLTFDDGSSAIIEASRQEAAVLAGSFTRHEASTVTAGAAITNVPLDEDQRHVLRVQWVVLVGVVLALASAAPNVAQVIDGGAEPTTSAVLLFLNSWWFHLPVLASFVLYVGWKLLTPMRRISPAGPPRI